MNNSDFKILDTIMRSMKRSIFIITPRQVLGTDIEYTDLSVVNIDTKINNTCIYMVTTEILKFIKEHPELDIENYLDNNCLKLYGRNELFEKATRVNGLILNCSHSERISDLKSVEEFNDIMALKAASGASMFKLSQTFIMSIFKGLIPVNASDKVGVEVYLNAIYPSFLARYTVDKKKYLIDIFVEYLLI